MIKFIFIFLLSLFSFYSYSQTIHILTGKPKISLRGLSVVDDKILWASGSNGTVARSLDGGKTFQWLSITGYEQRDFRDIEAFDANTAIIMAIAEPAIILKTKDGGNTWKKVFEDTTKGMFLDAMDFDGKYGVIVGDPVDDKMFMAKTVDYGDSWTIIKNTKALVKDEAFFASSGTNVKEMHTRHQNPLTYYVTGGFQSRFFVLNDTSFLPLAKGKTTTGANSIDCYGENYCVIVGGDFTNDKDTTGNCVLVSFKIKNIDQHSFIFSHPQIPPHGYRSCVEFINQNKLITCGTSGVDISNDGGLNWTLISTESFHVCQKAKQGSAVFLAGKDGRIAKLEE